MRVLRQELTSATDLSILGWLIKNPFFILIGVERIIIVQNFTKSTHFELEFVPCSYSLVGSLVWAALAYVVFRLLPVKEELNKRRIALVIAVAVSSHWILDLIVHTPDLPLLDDNSLKLGFGLWNNVLITFIL
jgi:hypothetical protein